MQVCEAVSAALEPYVGAIVANTCVRATAISLGKTADDLDRSDLPELENRIRGLLAPVAAPAVIEDAIVTLRRTVEMGG